MVIEVWVYAKHGDELQVQANVIMNASKLVCSFIDDKSNFHAKEMSGQIADVNNKPAMPNEVKFRYFTYDELPTLTILGVWI